MAVTIEQIARRAGVSAGTVSRILNGKNKENRPTIAKRAARVRRIASEMGYRPNAAARSMIRGRFGLVALMTCGDAGFDWVASSLLHGIHEGLEAHESRLVLNEVPGSCLTDPAYVPRIFRESAVDGVLVHIDSKLPQTTVPYFDSQPLPAVVLNYKLDERAVYPDEVMGGRVATEHLISKGRREVGFFRLQSTQVDPHFSIADRHAGFVAAMESAGLSSERARVGHTDYNAATGNGVNLAISFLDAFPDLTAVVCHQLPDALAVHAAASRRGMTPGEDLRILVFLERVAHAITPVPFDTAIIPFKQVGLQAVEMIMAALEAPADVAGSRVMPYNKIYDAEDQTVHDVVEAR